MRLVDVGVVYQKIKEMSQAGAGTGKTISVDTVIAPVVEPVVEPTTEVITGN